jgi:hypothetical protein
MALAAARTPASPIPWERPGAGPQSHWIVPVGHYPHGYAWGYHAQRRHAHLDLQALMRRYGRQTHGIQPSNPGPEHSMAGYPLHRGMCGGWPGSLVRPEPDGPDPKDGEDSEDPGEEVGEAPFNASGGDGGIAASHVPAVPEPGSLALMGAGMLGLMAASAFRKKPKR